MLRFITWRTIVALAVCAIFALTCELVFGQQPKGSADWPHWRGPQRNDIVAAPSGWSGKAWLKPKPDWSAQVGEGATSPIIAGGMLFSLGHDGSNDQVVALDAKTGQERWRQKYPAPRYARHATGDEGFYAGPTPTPEYDLATGWLYTLNCDGQLQAWLARDGAKKWSVNLYERYGMKQRPKVGRSGRRDYGYTSAPLVYKDWLLVEAGGDQGLIVALDKRTGEHVWGSQHRDYAGHTGGMAPIKVEGRECLAVLAFAGLAVVRIDGERPGATIATHAWSTEFANNVASAVAHNDCVLITAGYNHQAMCKLQISAAGAKQLWLEEGAASLTCSPVVHKGKIYWAWNQLRCHDWETGKPVWTGPAVGDAGSCLVTSDDRLIVWARQGELFLAETAVRSPKDYRELARLSNMSDGDVWPHVALAEGRVYVKDRAGRIHCFSPVE